MRRCLTLVVGVLIGQWLAFGQSPSPADLYRLGVAAWERHHYIEALGHWSRASALQPLDPVFHYRRATALARLGDAHAAADAYRLTLLLDPGSPLAHLARAGLADLSRPAGNGRGAEVPLEPARGVWVVSVVLDDAHTARFLLDTGSSVTLVAPPLAEALRLRRDGAAGAVELQTVGGRSRGSGAVLRSLRLGSLELTDVPVVVHDPGPGIDGILGNTVLGRYRLTLDAHRRLLRLGTETE
jgi:hypothetical protein